MGSLRADRGLIDPSKGHDARASPESNSGSLGSGVQSRSQKRVLQQGWTKGRTVFGRLSVEIGERLRLK